MHRFMITETPKNHVPISHIINLAERLIPSDRMEIQKELGDGYFVQVFEGEEIKPPKEFE